MTKIFIVTTKDLLDKKKNPRLSLSPRAIFKNKKIRKRKIAGWRRRHRADLIALLLFIAVIGLLFFIDRRLPHIRAYEERMMQIHGLE